MPIPVFNEGAAGVCSSTVFAYSNSNPRTIKLAPAANADYGVMKILYDAFPKEAQAIFTQYKEAFVGQGPPVTMSLVADLGK